MSSHRLCSVEGCEKTHVARGLCGNHYQRSKRTGELGGPQCSMENCDKTVKAKGLCEYHYRQISREINKRRYPICAADNCDEFSTTLSGGFCHAHRLRYRRGARMDTPIIKRVFPPPDGKCTLKGCERKYYGKGLCNRHYNRSRRDRRADNKLVPSICSVEGCERVASFKGMCTTHYTRSRYPPAGVRTCSTCSRVFSMELRSHSSKYCSTKCHRQAANLRRQERTCDPSRPKCSLHNCNRPALVKGMCGLHYKRVQGGSNLPLDAPPASNTKGSGKWRSNGNGYVKRQCGGTSIMQHRWVMEQHLGRPLTRKEEVHHINGVRHDNRIENLELWSKSHPYGQRVVDKLAWAREILAQYESEEALHQPMLF